RLPGPLPAQRVRARGGRHHPGLVGPGRGGAGLCEQIREIRRRSLRCRRRGHLALHHRQAGGQAPRRRVVLVGGRQRRAGQPPAQCGAVEMPLPQRAHVYGTDQEGPRCHSLNCPPNTCARRPCRRPCWPARTISPTGTTASTTGGTTPSSPASTSPWSGGSALYPPPTPTCPPTWPPPA